MKFIDVEAYGFLNIVEPKKTRLCDPRLTLVIGENGAGKSTLYSEAPTWALFGQTVRKIAADDVINRDSPEAGVTVGILDGEDVIFITRTKERKVASKLRVVKNGEDMFPAANLAELQQKLE